MTNLRRHIIIVHSSEVIRRGLYSVLKGLENTFLTMASGPGEIPAEDPDPNQHVLFIVEEQYIDRIRNDHGKSGEVNFAGFSISPDRGHAFDPQMEESEILDKAISYFPAEEKSVNGQNHLSQREKEILKHVALGFSNKEIADKLFISTHTVISHRKNITEKLGIKSISGLTVYALLNNIIDQSQLSESDLI